MKFLTFLLAVVLITGCSTTTPASKQPLKHFHESNFGISFSHSAEVSTDYNPHGSANAIPIRLKDKPVGALFIHSRPPSTNEAEFVSSGKEYFKRKFKASSIDYRLQENPQKYKFHVFRAKLENEGTDFITERYVHLRRTQSKDLAQAQLDQMFGTISFEFLAPAMEYPNLEKEIKTVIETFKLDKRD